LKEHVTAKIGAIARPDDISPKEQYAIFDEITQSWRTVTGLAREEEE
jgi:hypothetical protein